MKYTRVWKRCILYPILCMLLTAEWFMNPTKCIKIFIYHAIYVSIPSCCQIVYHSFYVFRFLASLFAALLFFFVFVVSSFYVLVSLCFFISSLCFFFSICPGFLVFLWAWRPSRYITIYMLKHTCACFVFQVFWERLVENLSQNRFKPGLNQVFWLGQSRLKPGLGQG